MPVSPMTGGEDIRKRNTQTEHPTDYQCVCYIVKLLKYIARYHRHGKGYKPL